MGASRVVEESALANCKRHAGATNTQMWGLWAVQKTRGSKLQPATTHLAYWEAGPTSAG